MTLREKWVKKIKPGNLVGLVSNNWIEPIIFKCWNGESSYSGHRAQYYYVPNNEFKEQDWKARFKTLDDPDSWAHHVSTINSRAENRLVPYPVEFLCKNTKKYIKLIKHLKGYEY